MDRQVSQNNTAIETLIFPNPLLRFVCATTGFVRRPLRGGVVTANREWEETTSLDPMGIDPSGRDVFPKTDLLGDYIGNRIVPLCVDLPKKHFLRKGATYKLLGGTGNPMYQFDPSDWSINPDLKRIELEPSSPLYSKLCSSSLGQCTFPSTVKIDENLVYDEAAMAGEEYAVDTLRTVMLKNGLSSPIFYEYVRQPCVELAFFENPKKVIKGQIRMNYVQKPSMCGNPHLEVATSMCSEAGWDKREKSGMVYCHYQGERSATIIREFILCMCYLFCSQVEFLSAVKNDLRISRKIMPRGKIVEWHNLRFQPFDLLCCCSNLLYQPEWLGAESSMDFSRFTSRSM
jgi:hypothetical protein